MHRPFNSKYLPNFQVVEQQLPKATLFPHTDQLPKLLNALNKEFRDGVPDKIARVDHRANGFLKIQRHGAVIAFCLYWNRSRTDRVRLFPLLDRNLVARVSIVQHGISHDSKGTIHRFRFYAGDDFFPEMHLDGRRVGFAGHVLDRFSERVPHPLGADLTSFLTMIFGARVVIMLVKEEAVAVVRYKKSLVALPIRQSDTEKEYFFATCLTVNELSELECIMPPPAYTFHFDPNYATPTVRHWNPVRDALELQLRWRAKAPLVDNQPQCPGKTWADIGHNIASNVRALGHREGSQIRFLDDIPGPHTLYVKAGMEPPRYIEAESMQLLQPDLSVQQVQEFIEQQRSLNPQWYS